MRDDHLTEAGAIELAWMRENGCGPDIRNVRAMVFLYDKPGPAAHVGLHVDGLGGPSLPIETARQLAAMLIKAASIAERDGAPAPVATPEELTSYDWFCTYCGAKIDEQTRDDHVRACTKHPMAATVRKVRALQGLLAIVANLTPAHESSTGGCSRNCTACQVAKVRAEFDALGGTDA